jgi:hypothetical protein
MKSGAIYELGRMAYYFFFGKNNLVLDYCTLVLKLKMDK